MEDTTGTPVTGIGIDQFQYLHFKPELDKGDFWVTPKASQAVTVGFLVTGYNSNAVCFVGDKCPVIV